MTAPLSHPLAAAVWHGRLDLGFARQGDSTVLVQRRACMPLAIQRPFYPEGPRVCHALLLHPPGGLAGGDRLQISLDLQPASEALITTPAAGKWYRGEHEAQQFAHIQLADDAHLEWLPQESIVFDGALAHQRLHVELGAGATWLGWDITRFGRSASGEQFRSGHWRAQTEIWRAREALWIDRQQLAGGSRLLRQAYGLAGQPVIGTLTWIGKAVTPELVSRMRESWTALAAAGEAGVTRLPLGLLCRYRGPSSGVARQWFTAVWDLLRREYRGRAAQVPRIWST